MSVRRFYDACAAFYDEDYRAIGRSADIELYVELALRAGGPVLEMGCGSGRVLLPTARAGIEITGVDASPLMLAGLRRQLADEPEEVSRRVRVAVGDIAGASLGEAIPAAGFSLVTAPFRVVQHLVSRAEQRAWLATVARHLAPGGELVFDVFQPQFDQVADGPAGSVDVEREEPGSGRRVRRVVWVDHHPELQTFDLAFEWLVEAPDGVAGESRRATTTVRWFTRCELENLLELAGFDVLEVWGDFDRRPHGPGAEEIVVRAVLARGVVPTPLGRKKRRSSGLTPESGLRRPGPLGRGSRPVAASSASADVGQGGCSSPPRPEEASFFRPHPRVRLRRS
ncbi:MAG TPA: class I SAM-dependent methyltransferase, partial [Thermoanaerobaculia bacterium]|nr:class I SAM-dependent methyltransferase [Thermoanaerobaculia bacterium]